MKHLILASFVLYLPATVLGAVGGHCAAGYDQTLCICLDQGVCTSYGGKPIRGSPGNWPCPYDGNNVMGCEISDHCPGKDKTTGCAWKDKCPYRVLRGKLPSLCPDVLSFGALTI